MRTHVTVVYCSLIPHKVPPSTLLRTAQELQKKHQVIFIDLPAVRRTSGWRRYVAFMVWLFRSLLKKPRPWVWTFDTGMAQQMLHLLLLYRRYFLRQKIILVTTLPDNFKVYKCIPYHKAAYDCTDQIYEDQMVEHSEHIQQFDRVFVNSQVLFAVLKQITPRVSMISSGYLEQGMSDLVTFSRNKIPKSIVFSGGISTRIDYPLLLQLVKLLPSYTFFFLGEVYLGKYYVTDNKKEQRSLDYWNSLCAQENVHYLGNFSQDQLKQLLPLFKVGIIPYDLNDTMNYYSNPMKFYEYLSYGLPVVSVPIPALVERNIGLPVHFCNSSKKMKDCILQACLRAATSNSDGKIKQLLQSQTMSLKVETINTWIQSSSVK